MSYTAASVDETSIYPALRELYTDDVVAEMAIRPRDYLKWIPKEEDDFGRGKVHIIDTNIGQGFGATLEAAQANAEGDDYYRAVCTPNDYYGSAMLLRKAMMRAENKGSVFDEKKRQVSRRILGVAEAIERQLWGDGTGSLGTIGSITNANPSVVTLSNTANIFRFKKGMAITAYNGGTARTDTIGRITAVDHSAGTFTMDANKVSAGSWQAGDLLYIGKYGGTGGTDVDDKTGNILKGLDAWFPATYESAGTFLTMDRTTDKLFLQGHRGTFQGTIENTLKALVADMSRFGAYPDSGWLSYSNQNVLENELGSRVVRNDGVATTFGLKAFKFCAPGVDMNIYAGSFCPDNVVWAMRRESMCLLHLGGVPHMAPTPEAHHSIDGREVRIAAFCEQLCKRPLDVGRAPLS